MSLSSSTAMRLNTAINHVVEAEDALAKHEVVVGRLLLKLSNFKGRPLAAPVQAGTHRLALGGARVVLGFDVLHRGLAHPPAGGAQHKPQVACVACCVSHVVGAVRGCLGS